MKRTYETLPEHNVSRTVREAYYILVNVIIAIKYMGWDTQKYILDVLYIRPKLLSSPEESHRIAGESPREYCKTDPKISKISYEERDGKPSICLL